MVARQVLPSGPKRPAPADLDRKILTLAKEHEGVLTCAQVQQSLQISRSDAQGGLDALANGGQARRVRGRNEVVYLFEAYLRQAASPSSGSGAVRGIFQAAVWAYGRWNDHQKSMAAQEQRLLDLAYHNRGWFTHAEAVHAIPRGLEECIERLRIAGLVEAMKGKNNQPVYVVAQFLPPAVECRYCQALYDVGEVQTCRKCGASFD
jgi:hypothetical protein